MRKTTESQRSPIDFSTALEQHVDQRVATLFRQLADSLDGHADTSSKTKGGGPAKRRKGKRKTTLPRTVSEEQILDLIKGSKTPLRVANIIEITGLTQSSAHKKIAALRASKSIKEVRDGTKVGYVISGRGGRGRKTTPKGSKKKTAAAVNAEA